MAIADKNLLSKGGSSDPRIKFAVAGSTMKAFQTHVKKKTLEPVFREQFAKALSPHARSRLDTGSSNLAPSSVGWRLVFLKRVAYRTPLLNEHAQWLSPEHSQ